MQPKDQLRQHKTTKTTNFGLNNNKKKKRKKSQNPLRHKEKDKKSVVFNEGCHLICVECVSVDKKVRTKENFIPGVNYSTRVVHNINCRLSRCSTARGSSSGLSLGGPTKVKAHKSFLLLHFFLISPFLIYFSWRKQS